MSDVWCPECEVTFRRELEACPSCGWLPPAEDDYLGQLAHSAHHIASKMLGMKERGELGHSPEVQRLHRIAGALGVMSFWDDAVRMEAEIMKSMVQPLFLAVVRDRHSDDSYALFRDPKKGKGWIKGQLQQGLDHYGEGEVREGVRGEDFFGAIEHGGWHSYFLTFDDGPDAYLVPIPSPNVQEGEDG